ncbi:MAG: threonine--tRNA ligase [Phycisphaerales bacterium]|nr:MAG: threonine--tRNA ligase [Phycisphaerales bacterium]
MPRITLPDGSTREFDHPVTAHEVAKDIGSGLAKAVIGAKIDGEICDLATTIDRDCKLELITPVDRKTGESSDEALYLIRHSCAHVMAEAIQRVICPRIELVYGPPVENGFYYDMRLPEGVNFSSDDFEQIEAEMEKIIKEDRPFTRFEMPVDEGMKKLRDEGSKYKLDNAERAVEAGSDRLSWYATGEPGKNWEDLCRGPHVPSTGRIGAYKITSLASSYWHGDADSDSLLRVYGTAFADQKQLDRYLEQLAEAKKRDHRVLGKQLRLFHVDETVGQGLILWTPNGAVVRQELQNFISEELRKQGYQQIFTPHIGKLELYKTSGHFPYYQDSQYPPLIHHEHLKMLADDGCSCAQLANSMKEGEVEGYLLKPMNCPHHIKIFDSQPHSYRDLPVRLAEFGTVYRWEQSGEIGGMTRVRGFTQDDAHLFCTEDQLAEELVGCLSLVKIIFKTLGMEDYRVRVGLRDPDSSKYVGDPKNWGKAEQACREAAKGLGVPFSEEAGEAAFYGPKIDFVVKDVVGREWQLGTVQVDYNLPERFDLSYIGPDNQPHRPVMIHRAPFGSMERFIGVLIEHFAGAFPTWLAPEQVRVLPISEKSADYGREVFEMLKAAKVRVTLDDSNERIQAKIREATEWKIPYLLIVGPRDAESRQVSVRARGFMKDLGAIPLDDFVATVREEITTRGAATVIEEHFQAAATA